MSTGDSVKKLASLIKGIPAAMMTTASADGMLHSRPMVTQHTDFDGTLWFFTRADSPKVGELGRDRRVNVSYCSPSDHRYVSVSGTAELVRDAAKVKELWHPALKAWFPKGQDDPELALLRIDPEWAEYWDSPSGTVVRLVGFVKAVVTGEPYKPGDNQKIDLRG